MNSAAKKPALIGRQHLWADVGLRETDAKSDLVTLELP